MDMSNQYGLTPEQTLEANQSLYEHGHVSYPRTSSRYIMSTDVDDFNKMYKAISSINPLASEYDFNPKNKRIVNNEAVDGHGAIIPTYELPDLNSLTENERNLDFLKETVSKIYNALLETEKVLVKAYPTLSHNLPKEIKFISTTELEEKYPDLDRKEREHAIAKEYKALFLYQIGWPLKDGKSHDGRAADYDDWNLNGDILLWYEPLGISLEISSMGIRVNKESLVKQLEAKGENYKLESPYVKNILNDVLPLTIGGGIGQSRMCMYMLKKAHIGEVQSSVWSKEDIELFAKHNIHLL
jgi:hypothetical protein